MLDFFSYIADAIEKAFSFLSNLVKSLFILIEAILNAFAIPAYLVSVLPAILGTAILTVFSIAVVKVIVGR